MIENGDKRGGLGMVYKREFAAEILGDLAALLFYALKWYNFVVMMMDNHRISEKLPKNGGV